MKQKRNSKELEELPKSLVKFSNAETTLAILNKGTLRWSTTQHLGDPFEYNHHSLLNFDRNSLFKAVIQTATSMIFSRTMPPGHSPMLVAIRRWRDEERFSTREEAMTVLKELCAQMVKQRYIDVDQIQYDWQQFASTSMVCCFYESHENPRLWQSFGDGHKGAAIKFKCTDYTALSEPYRIKYQKERPVIASLKDQVDYIISRRPSTPQANFLDLFITKSNLFRDEKELRCFIERKVEGDFEEIPFDKNDVEAIYLGALSSNEFREQITEIANEHYPGARIYHARPAEDNTFELAFHNERPIPV